MIEKEDSSCTLAQTQTEAIHVFQFCEGFREKLQEAERQVNICMEYLVIFSTVHFTLLDTGPWIPLFDT